MIINITYKICSGKHRADYRATYATWHLSLNRGKSTHLILSFVASRGKRKTTSITIIMGSKVLSYEKEMRWLSVQGCQSVAYKIALMVYIMLTAIIILSLPLVKALFHLIQKLLKQKFCFVFTRVHTVIYENILFVCIQSSNSNL